MNRLTCETCGAEWSGNGSAWLVEAYTRHTCEPYELPPLRPPSSVRLTPEERALLDAIRRELLVELSDLYPHGITGARLHELAYPAAYPRRVARPDRDS